MTAFSPIVGSFLVNYIVQSTLLLLAVAGLLRMRRLRPDLRSLLWKGALVAPILSSLIVTLRFVPHYSFRLAIDDADARDARYAAGQQVGIHVGNDVSHTSALGTGAASNQLPSEPTARDQSATSATADDTSRPSVALSLALPWSVLAWAWLLGVALAGLRVVVDGARLFTLLRNSTPLDDRHAVAQLVRLTRRAGIRHPVQLRESDTARGPFAAGLFRPVIVVPRQFFRQLARDDREALLAHEVAHLVRRDPAWNVIGTLVCGLFCVQPLNLLARRRMRIEAEYLADWRALQLLGRRAPLAGCLSQLGEWLVGCKSGSPAGALAVGMAGYRSVLGRRVELLLEGDADYGRSPRPARAALLCVAAIMVTSAVSFGPRAVADSQHGDGPTALNTTHSPTPLDDNEHEPMHRTLTTLAVTAALAASDTANAQSTETPAPNKPAATSSEPGPVPEGLTGFRGMLLGTLVSRDLEKGEFTATIDYVARVWENNTARDPRSAVGKTLVVEGITGKWIDQLLLFDIGGAIEFEAQHIRGDRLRFPGEWLRKSAPYDPKDHPVPPEEFRGFRGIVVGQVERKVDDSLEMVLKVSRVDRSFENSGAKDAGAVVDKSVVVAGFWREGFRKKFEGLKVGDTVRVGLQHNVTKSDHFSAVELLETTDAATRKPDGERRDETRRDGAGFPAGMQGFRGILIGRLVSKDVEAGQMVIKTERVKQVWKQNKASDLESCQGRTFEITGVSGKFLDVLLTLKADDRLEVEAFHNRGESLDFVGEWLKKIEAE